MNWKNIIVDELRNHDRRKQSLHSMSERIEAINCQKLAVKGSSISPAPKAGGASQYEARLINLISEQERLKLNMRATEMLVNVLDKSLDALDENERRIIDLFYIHPQTRHVERLMQELGYEQSQIYRKKDEALHKITVSMYGMADY